MKRIRLLYWFFVFGAVLTYAQNPNDSIKFRQNKIVSVQSDSIQKVAVVPIVDTVKVDTVAVKMKEQFKPDPVKVIWMGAVFPGFGQILNKKYWKLPIVYGGFLGFYYAISWNNSHYNSYKNGYRDIIDNDPTTNYFLKMLPRGYTIDTYPGGISTFQARLKTGMETYRQYRDLSIILTGVYYMLVLLDAYADAELFDFDIKPDLSFNVAPARMEYQQTLRSAYGLQCSIRF